MDSELLRRTFTTMQPLHSSIPVARRMHLCYFVGLLVSLAPLLVVAQSMPVPQESVRREQVQEVERYMERVEGEDRSVKYVVYVVLPALGLIGCLMVLRRFLLN